VSCGTPGQSSWDVYRLKSIGIRTISVTQTQFLINGKPFYFHGVDKHEDSDLRGKGIDQVLVLKDFNMMKWLHVNSFRTSHYPYADEFYTMADREGIVIIDETPAVGMRKPEYFNNNTLAHHKEVMFELIRRDKNHPSVIMWSIANEPDSSLPVAYNYFKTMANYTKTIDPTNRPITLVQERPWYGQTCAEFYDVVSINRYFGWYSDSGALDLVEYQMQYDCESWFGKYKKPVLVTEYGADTVTGLHSDPPVMFTEEFQGDFMARYQNVFDKLRTKFLIGELIWNFADFATDQTVTRVGSKNRKGILTRQRQPKAAAFRVRERYKTLGHDYECSINQTASANQQGQYDTRILIGGNQQIDIVN